MVETHETIDLYGKMLFEKAVIKPPFRKPNPMPDEACFLHIREGAYNSVSEEELLRIDSGQSVLMKCGQYLSQMIADRHTGNYEAVAVHFFPEVLRKVYQNDLPSFLASGNSDYNKSMVLVDASIAIDKYVEDILFYFEHRELINDDILIIKLKEIILLLLQTKEAAQIVEILENLFSERTLSFKNVIEAHLFSDLSLLELAQLTHMSLSSFQRKFKSVYQASPRDYFYQRRLEKARKLLGYSDRPISAIAYECGFNSVSHFSRKFREVNGISPSEYRLTNTEQ